ncbi:MAG TPA: 3-dehydroquinate synthase [Pyrinomonadaceae bacterium]|nr:3-dehydroquinate synthase [Pyrinomonadaceae bacterium]
MQKKVPIKVSRSSSKYDVAIGHGTITDVGAWASQCLDRTRGRVLIISNRKVYGLYGDGCATSLTKAGFAPSVHLIGDGERHKNLRTLESTLDRLCELRFTRDDAIIALGGGVVGDLAGFAASVYQRGVPFLQVPTTLLAMIDSSVGGKTAVNSSFGKNLIGSFYQPYGVLIDTGTLATLNTRELTAGFCEAVKQGAISGPKLLKQTETVLARSKNGRFGRQFEDESFHDELGKLIADQVRFKARIVRNDETESPENVSPQSRKILNFGHTLAHALEKVTNYKYLRHGEAVGHGIRFAAELSKNLELLTPNEVDLLNDVVHRAGVLPAISHIDPSKVIEAFTYDKKRIGESLNWVLLRGIGKPVIVPGSTIPRTAIQKALKAVQKQ